MDLELEERRVEVREKEDEEEEEEEDATNITVQPQTEQQPKRKRKPPLLLFWMLIPFFRRLFLYFVLIALSNEGYIFLPTILIAILKCSPIMTLTIFVFRQHNSFQLLWRDKYALYIFIGHLSTIVGAMILLFYNGIEALFLVGKLFHMIGWCLYTAAFGMKPFASRLFVRSTIAAVFAYYFLFIGGLNKALLVTQIAGGFYLAVLFTMQWRAWARVTYLDLVNGRWYEFFGGVGASLLVVSETISLINKYLTPSEAAYKLLGADYTTVAILYIGNMFIALSVVDGPNQIWPSEVAMQQQRLQHFKQSLGKPNSCIKISLTRIADWFFS